MGSSQDLLTFDYYFPCVVTLSGFQNEAVAPLNAAIASEKDEGKRELLVVTLRMALYGGFEKKYIKPNPEVLKLSPALQVEVDKADTYEFRPRVEEKRTGRCIEHSNVEVRVWNKSTGSVGQRMPNQSLLQSDHSKS